MTEAKKDHVGGWHRKMGAMDRMRGLAKYTDDLELPGGRSLRAEARP